MAQPDPTEPLTAAPAQMKQIPPGHRQSARWAEGHIRRASQTWGYGDFQIIFPLFTGDDAFGRLGTLPAFRCFQIGVASAGLIFTFSRIRRVSIWVIHKHRSNEFRQRPTPRWDHPSLLKALERAADAPLD